MTGAFDKDFWEQHWHTAPVGAAGSMAQHPPNPYLVRAATTLAPGTALDAGCGAGAEAIRLAAAGWEVMAVDISSQALERASERAAASGISDRIRWIEADLEVWEPDTRFDLVMSHYAHPAMPQLDFYDRIATWVKPRGSLLLVGHLHVEGHSGHDHHPPAAASVTAASVVDCLRSDAWRIDIAEEPVRQLTGPGGREVTLHDVVVHATRLR